MNELREIVRTLAVEADAPACVLATLVRLEGSGYRRPGARMLVRRDGGWAGFVSGGCLEADVAERARRVLDSGEPEVVRYDTRAGEDDVWGLAMGCNGIVDVLLEPVPPADDPGHPARLLSRLRARRGGALLTVVASDGPRAPLRASHAWVESDGAVVGGDWATSLRDVALASIADSRPRTVDVEVDGGSTSTVFVEPFPPPVRLLIAGAGPDAPPLVRLAHGLGWDVVIVDPRPAFADPARFAGMEDVAVLCAEPEDDAVRSRIDAQTAVVIMTHHFPRDRRWIPVALRSAAPYVGLLGPKRRTRDLLDRLGDDGFLADDDMRPRLHAPVGLDLGSTTPAEIALSIAAEVRAVLSGRTGAPLCERSGPIYDRPVP